MRGGGLVLLGSSHLSKEGREVGKEFENTDYLRSFTACIIAKASQHLLRLRWPQFFPGSCSSFPLLSCSFRLSGKCVVRGATSVCLLGSAKLEHDDVSFTLFFYSICIYFFRVSSFLCVYAHSHNNKHNKTNVFVWVFVRLATIAICVKAPNHVGLKKINNLLHTKEKQHPLHYLIAII